MNLVYILRHFYGVHAGSISVSDLAMTSPAYLDSVHCIGNEENLLTCSSSVIGEASCAANEGAGVRCACK